MILFFLLILSPLDRLTFQYPFQIRRIEINTTIHILSLVLKSSRQKWRNNNLPYQLTASLGRINAIKQVTMLS